MNLPLLESEFKNYLISKAGAIDIDTLPTQKFPKKKADYFIANKRSILEIKCIKSDRADALEPWLQKRIETSSEFKNGMPIVFGTIPFEQIYEGHSNKELFNKQLDTLAARTLIDYVRNAKHQIYETKKALACSDALGFLIILNEAYEFYETWFVYRMIQSMLLDIQNNEPKLKIDGVCYINESTTHKGSANIVFIHSSNELEDLTPNEVLDELARGWASYRGYKTTCQYKSA